MVVLPVALRSGAKGSCTRVDVYRMGTRWVRAGIAGAAALMLVGCGGGGGTELTRLELDARANTLCQEATNAIKAVGPLPPDFQTNAVSAAAYLDKVGPITDKTVSNLAALIPNASVRGRWADFIATNHAAQQALDDARVKAHRHDSSGLRDFQAATGPLTQALDASAITVGATACAN